MTAHSQRYQRYRPGDIVARRKGLLMHKGIALGDGRVFHNTPLGGEHIATEQEFLRGHRMHVQHLDAAERQRTLQAARVDSPRNYHLFANNCEHTVSRALTGEAASPQLKSWAFGLGLGALAFAATRHPAAAAAGYAIGRSIAKRLFD